MRTIKARAHIHKQKTQGLDTHQRLYAAATPAVLPREALVACLSLISGRQSLLIVEILSFKDSDDYACYVLCTISFSSNVFFYKRFYSIFIVIERTNRAVKVVMNVNVND